MSGVPVVAVGLPVIEHNSYFCLFSGANLSGLEKNISSEDLMTFKHVYDITEQVSVF